MEDTRCSVGACNLHAFCILQPVLRDQLGLVTKVNHTIGDVSFTSLILTPIRLIMKTHVDAVIPRIAVLFVLLGCYFRFAGLDEKLFWHDEVYTGLAIAGSSFAEAREYLFDGQDHPVAAVLVFQSPRVGKSIWDTIDILAKSHPRHPPLYFASAHLWETIWGSSTKSLRMYSAVMGLLSLPLAVLLCRELHPDRMAGWILVALVSVSPLHVIYAQEARPYLLWINLILLSSWLLLVGLRRGAVSDGKTPLFFALYAIATTLSLYTHLLSVLVLAAHVLFVVGSQASTRRATWRLFVSAVIVSTLLFVPWMLALWFDTGRERSWVAWAATPITVPGWFLRVGAAWSRPFVDLESWRMVVGVIPLGLAASCVGIVIRFATRRAVWFCISLIAISVLPFVVADVVGGGWRTGVIRFQWPAVLAVQCCVSMTLAYGLRSTAVWYRYGAAAVAVTLITCGVVSTITYHQAPVWWIKATSASLYDDAREINQHERPLVISSEHSQRSLGDLMALAHLLNDDVALRLVVEPEKPRLTHLADHTFVWQVSSEMRARLQTEGWQLEQVGDYKLHRLSRQTAP